MKNHNEVVRDVFARRDEILKQRKKNLRVLIPTLAALILLSARKDDSLIRAFFDFFDRNFVIRNDLRIYVVFTHTAGNQLIILSAEVHDENFIHKYVPLCMYLS